MPRWALAGVLAALLMTGPMFAATVTGQERKHSGLIVDVGSGAHTIMVEEMGPWTGPGATPARLTITLAPETRIELLVRSQDPAAGGGWPGDFAVVPLASRELHPGDFVTAVTTGSAGGLAASSISVVRPGPLTEVQLPWEHSYNVGHKETAHPAQ